MINSRKYWKKHTVLDEVGENVSVKLEPEPDNPYDSQAISFMCRTGGVWKRIGYVVREC